ncbi:MAG: hypothetical protein H0X29_03525 [Parachlamydiaceae bacterium]|nr:hypothetical protein [Parachlamydiaceae bacterium]
MKLSHTKLIVISGLIWFVIGASLLRLGLNLLITSTQDFGNYPLINLLQPYLNTAENAALFLVVIALIIGYFKGNFVLGKSARRGVERIRSFPNPTSIANIYSAKYYILLAVMIGLGISIKYMGLNSDVRGFVDVIIGSALINGAMLYFKLAASKNQTCAQTCKEHVVESK